MKEKSREANIAPSNAAVTIACMTATDTAGASFLTIACTPRSEVKRPGTKVSVKKGAQPTPREVYSARVVTDMSVDNVDSLSLTSRNVGKFV